MKHLAPFYLKKVKFDHHLLRVRNHPNRTWTRVPMREWKEGIVVGIRSLQNGRLVYLGYEDGYVFEADSRTLALVVVFSPYRNPVYVLPLDAHEIMPNGH